MTFSDFLYVQGIGNEVEREHSQWAIWVHSEDELGQAKEWFVRFQENPKDPHFQKTARQARELREREEREYLEAKARQFDRSKLVRKSALSRTGKLTITLAMMCLGVAILSGLGSNHDFLRKISIADYEPIGSVLQFARGGALPEVRQGEVWRLVTPIFIHYGPFHLLFNLLWLIQLGSMIETRISPWRLFLLVIGIGVISNYGQYYYEGPLFGGMSGVVYGLLSYVWIKSRYDPESGLEISPQTVTMMVIWFFICLFEIIPHVANHAHAFGLGLGLLWGGAECLLRRKFGR